MDSIGPTSRTQEKPLSTDWREVEQRLTAARAAIEHVWAPTSEEITRTLQERARVLARPPEKTELADEYIEVVEFRLAYETYALESHCVREVYSLESLTPLPCTPAFVLGIVNVRGEMLSVIDLKTFFELPEKGLSDLNKVIVIDSGAMRFGILADVINGVRRIARVAMQPSLPTLTGIREEYLLGVNAERIVVLDAKKLLTDKKLIVQDDVVA